MLQLFIYDKPFQLESGDTLDGFQLAYHTFGRLNEKRDNIIWIIHALTANSNPTEWWPEIVGNNKAIDPEKHFIICANMLGSPYGSTNPLSINPKTGDPYFHDFPLLTNRDIVRSYDLLRQYLQIDNIKLLLGPSLGGQQALEWSIININIDHLILLATNARHSPYGIAFNESQRMAISLDPTWKENHPEAGLNGMKVARSIGMLSYRSYHGYQQTQLDLDIKIDQYLASSYQNYQGEKLAKRFNAFSYWILTKAMDSHHVGRGRNGIQNALKMIRVNTTIISIDSDVLFPHEDQKLLYNAIPNNTHIGIISEYGHDGFLIESQQITSIIHKVLASTTPTLSVKPTRSA